MAEQQLNLKVGGNSDAAVGAVAELASALQAAVSQIGSFADQLSSSVGDTLSSLTQAAQPLGEQLSLPFAEMADGAAKSSDAAKTSVIGMVDEMLAAMVPKLAASAESVKDLGKHIESGFADPLGHAKTMATELLQELGPLGVGLIGIGAAVLAVGTGLLDLAKNAAAAGEKIENFSMITGVSVEKVGALSATATIAGGSLDGMQSMLTQMTRRLDATGPAADKMNTALKDINVNVEDFRAAAPDERIRMLADGFQNATDKSKNMSNAIAIMGRSGVSNLPLLMHMTDDVREAGEKLGYTWDEVSTQQSTKLNQELNKTGIEMSTVATTIGVALLPAATLAVEVFNRTILALEHIVDLGGLVSGGWHLLTGAIGETALAEETYANMTDTVNRLWKEQGEVVGPQLHDTMTRVAEQMIKLGYEEANVAEQTGMTTAEVKKLKKELDDSVKDPDGFTKKQLDAIDKLKAGIEGESTSIKERTRAVEEEIKNESLDDEGKQRLVDSIEKLKKGHQSLSPEVAAYLQANKELTPEYIKQKTAVDGLIASWEGDSKAMKTQSVALDLMLANGVSDEDVQKRLIDLMDTRIGKHIELTAKQQKFYDDNSALGARAIAQQQAIESGWDNYYATIQKDQGDSLALQDAATQKWYDAQYAAISKMAAKNSDEWARLEVLNAEYSAKLANNADAHQTHEQAVATAVGQKWSDYYATVAKTDKQLIDSQIDGVNKWYEAQYSSIEKAARANIDEWDNLTALNAVFWAKLTKIKVDAETTANAAVRAEQVKLDDFLASKTMTASDFQMKKIWDVVNEQIAADKAAGKSNEALNALRIQLAQAQTDALYVDDAALQKDSLETYRQIADKAWETYDEAMADSDNYTDKAIQNFRKLAEQAERSADDTGSAWGGMFDQIFAKDLPKALSKAFQGGGGFAGAVTSIAASSGGKLGGAIMGDADEGTGLLGKMFDSSGGLAEGLVSGFASAGISTALTIGSQLLIKGLTALFGDHTADHIARDAGTRFGTTFSKATSDAILKDKNGGMTEMAAELNNLSAIIKDAGGLGSSNLATMTARLHDVFSMIETHQMTVAQGAKVMDDNWQAFATAGTDADGRLSDSLKEIIKLNDTVGTQSKAIADYLKGQGASAMEGFAGVVDGVISQDKLTVWDGLKGKIDAATKASVNLGGVIDKMGTEERDALQHGFVDAVNNGFKGTVSDFLAQQAALYQTAQEGDSRLKTWLSGSTLDMIKANGPASDLVHSLVDQQKAAADAKSGLDDLGIQAVASFSAAVASGTSETDALTAIHPALQKLEQSYDDLGIKTDDAALAALMMRDKIATAAPQMVKGIGSLSQEMVSLDNMGLMNVKTFGAMERSGQTMYDQLVAKVKELGGTDADALSEMQKYLHDAQKEAENLGIPLDDNTQKLIDQSKQAGIWQDALSPQDKLLKGMQTLVDKVSALVDKLNGIPAKVDTTVTTHFVQDGDPNGDPNLNRGARTEVPSFDNRPMERVTSAGLALLHPGDMVGVPPGGLGGFGGGAAIGHLSYMANGIDSLNDSVALLPDMFARKVRDAIQMAGN